jgi:uncharacterized protein YceH (UPF0502 family)
VRTVTEGRVLGTLIEKELTTPDQYPLSANALVLGCNQSTNREPVMRLEAAEVEDAVRALKEERLARIVHPTHGRGVTKYRHVVHETLGLEPDELAVLGVLLLRGPQTAGEIRTRAERLHAFASVGEVEDALARLAARPEPLAVHLERHPGQKEARWAQLLAAEPAPVDAAPAVRRDVPTGTSSPEPSLRDRVEQLEARVQKLEAALGDLLGE